MDMHLGLLKSIKRYVMRLGPIVAAFLLLAAPIAYGDTLATVTGGQTPIDISLYVGQSFSVLGSGSYTNIVFNFFTPAGDPYALGTGYLFSNAYTGTPTGLASAAGYLGSAVSASNTYSFAPSVTLTAGNTYYFFEDTLVPQGSIGGGPASSDFYYAAYGANALFGPGVSGTSNYLVTGDLITESESPVPEPSSLALLGSGTVATLVGLRRRINCRS
jgi:PEP-CTERM motif-containing protein